jgi:hypothetical protein
MSIIDSFLEINLPSEKDFLKVKETLTRIGISSRKEKKLYQSCHILHKQGRYYIVHFKELFSLDGKQTDITIEDIARRNTIAGLLEEWNLVTVLNKECFDEPKCSIAEIKIISHKEKNNYELVAKYTIGKKK